MGWLGGDPTHVYIHMHAHTHAHRCMHGKHDNFMQMAAPMGESLEIPYDVICMCMCVCACVCMHVCVCTCVEAPPWMGGQVKSLTI